MKKIILLLCMFLLTGCAKTTDIEDRNYALVLGIDKREDKYEATFSFANLSMVSSPGEKARSNIVTIQGESLQKIQEKYKEFNDKKLELGHLNSIVFGDDLILDEEMKRSLLKELEKSPEYAKTVLCFTADQTAREIVEIDNEIQGMLADFLNNMYYNNLQKGYDRPVTLEKILQSINEDEVVAIPRLSIRENAPAIKAYDIFDQGVPNQRLSVKEYQLFLLLNGKIPYQTVWINGVEIEFMKVKSKGTDPLILSGVMKVDSNLKKERINREIRTVLKKLQSEIYYDEIEIETDFTIQ